MDGGFDLKAYCLGILVLLCLVTVVQAEVAPNGKWKNSLKPKGQGTVTLTLATNGSTDYAILLPSSPTSQEQKAAADLSEWLKTMTGAAFIVVKESTGTSAKKVISVGNTYLAASSGFNGSSLGKEGYAIDVKGKSLFLTGGRIRGPINAVYALLEEDLGCRWYARTSTPTIPHVSTLTFKPVVRRFVPVLEIRDPFYWDAFDGTWSLRNRTNSPSASIPEAFGGNVSYALFVHTFATLVPPSKYFAEHPEYFSENDGKRNPNQLCVSNPETLKIAIASVKEILKNSPTSEIISVSQNDGSPCCDCPVCRKVAKAEGSLSGPLLKFVNAVADAIAKDFPNVKISTLAYLDTFIPPKTVKPRPNVAIQLCTDSHAWSEPFLTIPETKKFQTAMKGWAKIGANINIWDYTVNFSHYSAPMPNMQVVTDDIRFFFNHNAKGVMLQGAYQGPGASDGPMKSWVWGKQLWDPTRDTKSLIRDFTYGYFGAAAGPMMEYQDMMWNTWEKNHRGSLKSPTGGIRYEMNHPIFSKVFLSKATDMFDRAKKLATDDETLKRVELAELAILYVELSQNLNDMIKNGKPDQPAEFKARLDRFEKIARREGVIYLWEGGAGLDDWITRLRRVASEDPNQSSSFKAKSGQSDVSVIRMPARWKFSLDKDNKGVENQWFASNFDDSKWGGCRADMDTGWESQGFTAKNPSYGWYRQKQNLSSDFTGKHIYMYFGAVDEDAYIYVNGTKVIDHTCDALGVTPEQIWNAPFILDATSAFKSGQDNTVAVRVYNRMGMGGVWKPSYILSSNTEMTLGDVQAVISQEPVK